MGGIYNTGNFHLYDYAGNNPVKLRIQRENLITLQFFRVAVQIFGGGIEVTAGLLAEGVSVGVSTYAVIDGIYNVADGIIGMTAAACDKKYDGAIPEVASAIAEKTGATKEQQ